MENFVFLTNQYLPKPGATGLCVHKLAKKLAEKGENVYTICYEDGDKEKQYDGVNVVKIHIPPFLKDNQSASNIKRKYQYCMSLFSKLVHLHRYPLRSMQLVYNYIKEVEKIVLEQGYVTIIASYTPLEAVVAAMKIKKKYPNAVKIVYYSTDTLSNEQSDGGILSRNYRTKSGINWEKKLFEVFDKILVMECHKDHYYSDIFEEFREKFALVNFPLFEKIENYYPEEKNNINEICLVYAGTLYQKLRNPCFLNSILIGLSEKIELEAIFLGGGDCEEIMKKAEEDSKESIKYLGMQPHNIAKKYISSADILLSIGNVESPMAPSKIYEYMSTGKPIIHTYTYDKDPCIEPLRRYGNALLLKNTDQNGVRKALEFIKNRSCIQYEEVEKVFIKSTPSYTINIILEELGDQND